MLSIAGHTACSNDADAETLIKILYHSAHIQYDRLVEERIKTFRIIRRHTGYNTNTV